MRFRHSLLVAVALLAVACGDDDSDAGAGATSPSTSSTSTITTTTAPRPPSTPSTPTTAAPASCSAGGHGPVAPQDGLPAPVAQTRDRIVAAASACDFEALDAVGDPHVSFGGETDAAAHWRAEEDAGHEPLRHLVELLDRPYAVTTEGRYVWPAAYARDSWEAVTPAEREHLRPLYDEDDFEQFAGFGSYIGWRVGIDPDGAWAFFVAGD